VIEETIAVKHSERQGRAIDNDSGASMEEKKIQGYF
jgi:sulfate adenylyltransferase subunit 2